MNILTPADLRQWRISRHLTQAQAAALVGAGSFRTWQNWERSGRDSRPIPKWLENMLKLLDKDGK